MNTQQSIRQRSRRPTSLKRKLLLAATSVLLAGLACEAAVRIRAWFRYGSAQTNAVDELLMLDPALNIFVPKPNTKRQGGRIGLSVNAMGFRGSDFSIDKPEDTFRIICLGASTTFCGEVTGDDKTWPKRLQDLLSQEYPFKIEVINAGIPGASSSTSLINLTERCLKLDPDLVIFYEANNEIAHDTQQLAIKLGLIESTRRTSPAIQFLSRYSLLVELIYKNLAIRTSSNATRKLESIPDELPAAFLSNIAKMKKALHERNTRLVLSTFLTKYRSDQDEATQIRNADVAFYYMPWLDIQHLIRAMDVYNLAIINFGKEHGVPVASDFDAVPGDDEHFVDCMHFSDQGCEKMARRFHRFLVQQGLIQPISQRQKEAVDSAR